MKRSSLFTMLVAAALTWLPPTVQAQTPAPGSAPGGAPGTPGNGAAPAPADATPTDPRIIAILDAIERQSSTITTYQAKLRLDQVQGLQGDEQRRFGSVHYVHGKPVRFGIHFQSVVINNKLKPEDRQWVFDGQWLVERLNDRKQFIKRQIADPALAEDPLSLERSKFPIPLRPNRQEVLQRFAVAYAEPGAQAPENSFRLVLTPRPNSGLKLSQIHVWYDRNTLLPVRCMALDNESGDELTYTLTDAKVNEPIDPRELDTSTPAPGSGWDVQIKPWQQ